MTQVEPSTSLYPEIETRKALNISTPGMYRSISLLSSSPPSKSIQQPNSTAPKHHIMPKNIASLTRLYIFGADASRSPRPMWDHSEEPGGDLHSVRERSPSMPSDVGTLVLSASTGPLAVRNLVRISWGYGQYLTVYRCDLGG